MAYVLTNGLYYIYTTDTGKIEKTNSLDKARKFDNIRSAKKKKDKAPGKCARYYCADYEEILSTGMIQSVNKYKRKSFCKATRQLIYNKTNGYCYLCGDFVDFDSFEVEHKIPLAKSGTNNIDNLFCSCHICNTLKGSIAPADLLEKINQIYMYQMKLKNQSRLAWRIIHKLLIIFE